MFGRGMIWGLTVVVSFALLGTGVIAPKPAVADNDLERALWGIAAGAAIYGMIGDDDDYERYDRDRRGFYNGNSRAWERKYDRRDHDRGQHGPTYRDRSYSRSNVLRRTYNRGWNNGYDVGYDHGYDRGFDRGYDYGYDDGWDDRGDYERYRDRRWCW